MKKAEFIDTILSEEGKKNLVFKEFVKTFYEHVSFGYITSLVEQTSKDVLVEIAGHAFAFIKDIPDIKSFKIKHSLLQSHGLQILMLHSFDKPFVVRSTKTWLQSNKLGAEEFIHPIFTTVRSGGEIVQCQGGLSKESLIVIILPINQELPPDYQPSMQNLYSQLVHVVDDFSTMKSWIEKISNPMLKNAQQYIAQAGAFVSWLRDDNFVFLGLRYYKAQEKSQKIVFEQQKSEDCGILKIKEIASANDFLPPLSDLETKTQKLFQKHLMGVQKKQTRSIIYRGSRMDEVRVLHISDDGKIQGLLQIIGLFTSDFYKTSPLDVPWLKDKAEKIFEEFGFSSKSHNETLLKSILDSVPLDEFYYFSNAELCELITRILNMYDRNAISARYDGFGNSLSVLVYIPKHRYSEQLSQELGKLIAHEYQGTLASTHTFVGESSFARLIYILNMKTHKKVPVDLEELEEKVWVASQTWQERFQYFCRKKSIDGSISFSPLYLKVHDPKTAADDAEILVKWLKLDDDIKFEAKARDGTAFIRVFRKDSPITLGQIIPMFKNFQLDIQSEQTFFAQTQSQQKVWIHDYEISELIDVVQNTETLEKLVTGLQAAWGGVIEVDPYNALIVSCALDYKQIVILRTYGRYLKQLGFNYSQKAIAECLVANSSIAKMLTEYFHKRFSLAVDDTKRASIVKALDEKIFQEFSKIKRLDHDRILRRILNAMAATLRTNAYQTGDLQPYPCVSIKVQSTAIIDVPKPAPLVEIFVYSPTMEGCHLRGGKISRGGIRWSDRPEDFRFEVLGLMKAQMVKNAVIVPLGSKGGFVVKNYTAIQEAGGSDTDLKSLVINAYKDFIEQLLSLTDNLVNNHRESPKNMVIHDDVDQYLVVAADKGTATFSDTANELSKKVGFWLGDAFASGGSKGYDHKKLAITARGAWIAVRRHFWELGVDSQSTPITTVAVGDMAGDVFGNAMLQSTKICLVAAFNHRHIFLDPSPDYEIGYEERKRLFSLPQSSWQDYNPKLISKGGGVYERSEKFIKITPEVAKVFTIEQAELTPDELITKILQAEVDLLFFGGIGTFAKSDFESHTSVADRSNDAVRIDAKSINAKVVGEGANLGLTQLGRIEYALNGGRINTDAIDNSAGVDCSDHEVNLKVMCQTLAHKNVIDEAQRDALLASLADEVCELVLEDNWAQTLILTRMEEESKIDINAYLTLIKNLQIRDFLPLEGDVEKIPSTEQIQQRINKNLGLTRPELAILLAYSKIHLCQDLLHALKNNACFGETYYTNYFPKKFQTDYKTHLNHHPLKTEITATVLSNLIVNTMGPCFVGQMSQAFRVDSLEVVRAFIEALEETAIQEQLEAYKAFTFNREKTLKDLKRLTSNLAQCVMLRLSSPEHVFAGKLKYTPSSKIPFSVLFCCQITKSKNIDIQKVTSTYETLDLSYLWDWAEKIVPLTSWQTGSWLILQRDLIKILAHLCSQNWSDEKILEYNQLFEQLKNHISHSLDSSQHLLLLDYIIRQLQTL